VRDLLLGRRPADFDVGTNAHPNQIKKLFRNAFLIGRRFRLAHIRFQDGKIIEVSTFRRKPDEEELAAERAEQAAAEAAAAEAARAEEEKRGSGLPFTQNRVKGRPDPLLLTGAFFQAYKFLSYRFPPIGRGGIQDGPFDPPVDNCARYPPVHARHGVNAGDELLISYGAGDSRKNSPK
jgi:hypothetical protein